MWRLWVARWKVLSCAVKKLRLVGGLWSGEKRVTRRHHPKFIEDSAAEHLSLLREGIKVGLSVGNGDRCAQEHWAKCVLEGLVLRTVAFCLLPFIACCGIWYDNLAGRP